MLGKIASEGIHVRLCVGQCDARFVFIVGICTSPNRNKKSSDKKTKETSCTFSQFVSLTIWRKEKIHNSFTLRSPKLPITV